MSRSKYISTLSILFFLFTLNLSAQNILADEAVGTYTGKMGKNGDMTDNYTIEITKVDDTTVKIAPVSGNLSSEFEATVEEKMLGNIRSISFSTSADVMLQNAMLVPSTGRLSYAIVKMGSGSRDVEIFNGSKD